MVWLSQMASSPQKVDGCKRLGLSRRVRIAIGNLDAADGVVHRIEYRQIIAAFLRRTVDQAVRVHAGVALVGGDFVVEIHFRAGPVPLRDHDVALEALRPRRRLSRQFAVVRSRVVQSPN